MQAAALAPETLSSLRAQATDWRAALALAEEKRACFEPGTEPLELLALLQQVEQGLRLLGVDAREPVAGGGSPLQQCPPREEGEEQKLEAALHGCRRELGRLVELCARRSAQLMPFAALGRAALAALHGDYKLVPGLLQEFQSKLGV